MRIRAGRMLGVVAVAWATVGLAGLGSVGAQDRDAPQADAKAKANAKPGQTKRTPRARGGLRVGVGAPPKNVGGGAVDPLANPDAAAKKQAVPGPAAPPEWPFHVAFRLTGGDGQTLSATFYPARGGTDAPVLMLVHQTGPGHSSEDFQKPAESLKGQTLAEHLQQQDYAVLLIDLRGHGPDVRRQEVNTKDTRSLVNDLHTAYRFLIDRHNRRELNLAKFGVIAVGDGATLAAGWAALDNGAVPNPGRLSDLGALVMISPVEEMSGMRLAPSVNALAPRLPMLIVAGSRDSELAKAAQPILERNRLSTVKFFETRLQGNRLLDFEPEAITTILKFLDEPVKFRRNADWEPRYLLQPIAYGDIQFVAHEAKAEEKAAAPDAKADAKPAPDAKAAEKAAAVP